jgi:hypothetical protein
VFANFRIVSWSAKIEDRHKIRAHTISTMVNEATPLNGPQAADSMAEVKTFVSNLFSDENVSKARSEITGRMDELRRSASDGDLSIRLLALLAGVALMFSAVTGILGDLMMFNITGALMEIYTLILSLIILVLESKRLHLPDAFMRNLYKYALFLRFVWGRGCLYFVAGTLQLAQGTFVDYGVGGFVMLVGVLYIVVGRQTAQKLRDLRKSIYSEDTLRTKFREADTETKGALTIIQFKTLAASLGMDLNGREAEAAFEYLDKSHDGTLSYEEFKTWWSEWAEDHPIRNILV